MKVLRFLPLLLVSVWAHAQEVVINPNLTYFSRNLEQTTGSNLVNDKVNVLTIDTKAGYLFNYGLFVGGQVAFETGKSGGTDLTNYFFGPTVGYSCDVTGLFLTATYHLLGKSDLDAAGEYSKVTGLQIDVGYPLVLTETMKFGPQLSWKNLDLKDGSNGLADNKLKQLTPYFGLWLYF